MRIPTMQGTIDRRILINFRVEEKVIARACPPPFRPLTVQGFGIAGICLIRLTRMRPHYFPQVIGLSSENAAHRIAVKWQDNGQTKTGVYIPRRDTSSWLNSLVGGRIFPGVHHRARFDVLESETDLSVDVSSSDGQMNVAIAGKRTQEFPTTSIFDSLKACSTFFRLGSLGLSDTAKRGMFDGLELKTQTWDVEPLEVTSVRSSFFDNQELFPEGTIRFDNALLMQDIQHEWCGRDTLCCADASAAPNY